MEQSKNNKSIILAFGYKKGSGKNSVAKFISTHIRCEHRYNSIKEVSFAAKLKDICYQLYKWAGMKSGVYYETHYDEKEIILPELGKSPRQIWIEVGNYLRKVYKNTWIDYALKGVKANVILITDLGFINEAHSIQQENGYLIKINREDIPRGTDGRETELDSWGFWDYIIENNGSLEDLYQKAIELWNKIYEENKEIFK